ncbi:MAG: GTPase Era [Huintestinicola sp.]
MGTKSVFVTIAGRANAGKSSLLNALIGEKIAMVSDKPQTTRTKITGVLTKGDIQYVFMDTPGIQKAKNKLGEHMNKTVRDSFSGIDAVLFMADVTKKINESDMTLINGFKASKTPVILLLNKTDLVSEKTDIAVRIAQFAELYDFASVIPVSVLERDGIDIVMEEVTKFAQESPHYFPDDSVTDQPEKVIMSEIIREKLLILMRDEVPHGIAVTIETLDEGETRNGEDILNIGATIFCERDSHKGMVIGKGGAMLRKVGQLAREELEEFFRIKVNLQLWVKVKEDWRNREGLIRNFGLSNNSTDKN